MSKPLVIVESPAKARTIGKFLGNDFVVEASIGHIRDLPQRATDMPARFRGKPWTRLGVNVDDQFQPIYVIPKEKKDQVKKLKSLLADAPSLYLATDEDREGESIAWHLEQVLKPNVPVHRLVFHEITENAIQKAIASPRAVNTNVVRAQETRRILDRLFGFEVSELLWKKVRRGLSAGRVQSVAVRLVVERERLRIAFHSASFWTIKAIFETDKGVIEATLARVGGKNVALGKDFDPDTGQLKAKSKALHIDEAGALGLVERLTGVPASIADVKHTPFRERPAAPFTTSTLQQEANRKLRWTAKRTMRVAQRLYENGWITYMRTDSTSLSKEAISAARGAIKKKFGADCLPDSPRSYANKARNAQEAHEAIRPAGTQFKSLDDASSSLESDEARLYGLVWKRTVASQMVDAQGSRMKIIVGVEDAQFDAQGKTYTIPGFRLAYVEDSDDPQTAMQDREQVLPQVAPGDTANTQSLEPVGKSTKPPARLTEATLVKEMELRGIGRPSTYASIIDTILSRGYVFKKGTALVPTFTAFAVTNFLCQTLSELVDYEFTARMEDDLDRIALGEQDRLAYLQAFYHGEEQSGLQSRLAEALENTDAREVCSLPMGENAEGEPIIVRIGRYGAYLAVGEDTADIPKELPPDELDVVRALELVESVKEWPKELGAHPETGAMVTIQKGPYGFYVQLEVEGADKPKRVSLLPTLEAQTLDLETAVKLLQLPRDLGPHPESGESIQVLVGRYGPYIKCAKDTRSLPEGVGALAVTLEQAIAELKAPKRGRGRDPGQLLGTHPETSVEIRIKKGRYGPYVTDGTTNASIPRDSDATAIDLAAAIELIANRAANPRPRRGRKKKKS